MTAKRGQKKPGGALGCADDDGMIGNAVQLAPDRSQLLGVILRFDQNGRHFPGRRSR